MSHGLDGRISSQSQCPTSSEVSLAVCCHKARRSPLNDDVCADFHGTCKVLFPVGGGKVKMKGSTVLFAAAVALAACLYVVNVQAEEADVTEMLSNVDLALLEGSVDASDRSTSLLALENTLQLRQLRKTKKGSQRSKKQNKKKCKKGKRRKCKRSFEQKTKDTIAAQNKVGTILLGSWHTLHCLVVLSASFAHFVWLSLLPCTPTVVSANAPFCFLFAAAPAKEPEQEEE